MAKKKVISDWWSKDREDYYNNLTNRLTGNRYCNNDGRDERVEKALANFQVFVDTYFKHYTVKEDGTITKLGKFHLDLIKELDADKCEILAEFPRGHAKTTVFSLFAPIYYLLKGGVHLVVLISDTKDSAVRQLINLQAELETNQQLIADFSEFRKDGSWSRGEFTVANYNCKFTCAGKGQSIRGLKNGRYRPDFVIVDDIDTDKHSRNKELVKSHYDWLMQNVFNAMEITKYKFLFVGNRFAHNMVLDLFSKVEGIRHIRINALDVNGEPVWNDRFTKEDLLRVEQKIGKIRFLREYMNTPIMEGSVFKEEWLQLTNVRGLNEYDYIVSYLDPSWKKNSDFKSVVTIGFINKDYHIIDIYLRKQTMRNVIEYLYELNDRLLRSAYSIYFEANFMQDLHQLEFDKIAEEKGFNLPIRQDKDKKPDKEARIESMSAVFENLNIYINKLIVYSLDYTEFKLQYLSFPALKNDDGLDAMQSAYSKLNEHIRRSKFAPMIGEDTCSQSY